MRIEHLDIRVSVFKVSCVCVVQNVQHNLYRNKWGSPQILRIPVQMKGEAVKKGMCTEAWQIMQVRNFYVISDSCPPSTDRQIPQEFLASFKYSQTEMVGGT